MSHHAHLRVAELRDTRERTRMEPGAAFDTVTTALAGLHDAAISDGATSVAATAERLLIAAYELLRDAEIGDRAQQLVAALAACGRRQPTVLIARGLRVELTPGAASAVSVREHNAVRLLCLMGEAGRLQRCEHARFGSSLVPTCRHTVCTVVGQLERTGRA